MSYEITIRGEADAVPCELRVRSNGVTVVDRACDTIETALEQAGEAVRDYRDMPRVEAGEAYEIAGKVWLVRNASEGLTKLVDYVGNVREYTRFRAMIANGQARRLSVPASTTDPEAPVLKPGQVWAWRDPDGVTILREIVEIAGDIVFYDWASQTDGKQPEVLNSRLHIDRDDFVRRVGEGGHVVRPTAAEAICVEIEGDLQVGYAARIKRGAEVIWESRSRYRIELHNLAFSHLTGPLRMSRYDAGRILSATQGVPA